MIIFKIEITFSKIVVLLIIGLGTMAILIDKANTTPILIATLTSVTAILGVKQTMDRFKAKRDVREVKE